MKLIKINSSHFIIVDDSEIKYNPNGGTNGNFLCLSELEYGWQEAYVKNVGNCPACRRITHSYPHIKRTGELCLDNIKELLGDLYSAPEYTQWEVGFDKKSKLNLTSNGDESTAIIIN